MIFSPSFLAGLGTGLSLIVAIGAQNAFVLKQGLRRQHVFAVSLFCAVSDALLIAAGVAGAGAIARNAPWFLSAMRWGGAAFLIWYGFRSARAAWHGGEALRAEGAVVPSLGATLGTIAALTWLNPHVYLDTVVLLGTMATPYPVWGRATFAAGGALASAVWFLTLGFGSRWLAPVFASPGAWRVLDGVTAATMLVLAGVMVLS